MKTSRKSKTGKQRSEAKDTRALVGRPGLAAALGVSLRTVDRMLAAGEVVPVRMRGWSVRFYLPDVVECLRRGDRKWGRGAVIGDQWSVASGKREKAETKGTRGTERTQAT